MDYNLSDSFVAVSIVTYGVNLTIPLHLFNDALSFDSVEQSFLKSS
jgi:hypothetical protein